MSKIVKIALGLLLMACNAWAQGIKFSALPFGIVNNYTSLVGVQDTAGGYVDKQYDIAQLEAYLNGTQTFDQVLHNGYITSHVARFTDGISNTTDIDHGLITLSALGYQSLLYPGTWSLTNTLTNATVVLSVLSDPGIGLSNTSGTYSGYIKAADITADHYYRMPDTSGTVALLQNVDEIIYKGSGSPEGVVTASLGSIYVDTLGGDGTTMWVKELAISPPIPDNTGWNVLLTSGLGGSVTSITAGTGLSGGTITTTGTISMPNVGTAATYGDNTHIPVITTDAQGRVSAVSSATVAAVSNLLASGNIIVGNASGIASAVTAGGDATVSNTGVIVVDSSKFATRLRVQKAIDSLGINLKTLANDKIFIGNASNVETAVTASGDAAISNTGVIVVDSSKFATRVRVQKAIDSLNAHLGTVTSVSAGTGLSGGTITATGTISMPNTGTAGTYGDATHVPVFTTDAQGRVTSVTNTAISAGSSGNIANATLTANNDYTQHWNKKQLFIDSTKLFVVTDTTGDSIINMGRTTTSSFSAFKGRLTYINNPTAGSNQVTLMTKGGVSTTYGAGLQASHTNTNNVNQVNVWWSPQSYEQMLSNGSGTPLSYWEIIMGAQTPINIDSGSKKITLTDDSIQMRGMVQAQHLTGYNAVNPTISAGTGAGTSPVISISGDDLGGYISLTTGASPTSVATIATITFASNYYIAPRCVILSPADSNSSALNGTARAYVRQPAVTTSAFTIYSGASSLSPSTSYKWFYYVKQ